MALVYLPNGIGETLGDVLVRTGQLYANANIRFVHHTGSDTYDGLQPQKPFATFGAGVTASSAGDILVLLDGHTETLTSAVALTDITVVGSGQSSGKPTVKLTNNQAAGSMITVGAGETQLLNVWLEEEYQANTSPKVSVDIYTSMLFRMRGCYVECNANDGDCAVDIVASDSVGEGLGGTVIIKDTTFISTATSLGSQPYQAITSDPSENYVLVMDGVTFDNGTVGWSENHAMSLTAGPTVAFMENINMLNGADIEIDTTTYGYVGVGSKTGSGRVDWA